MVVNQWVPAAHKGDAIGDSARRVRGLLRGLGHESEIYALTIDDDLKGEVRPFSDPASKRGDLTIFHFALVSPLTREFARLPGGRVLQYHNVTPAHYFADYDANIFRLAMLGREDLKSLVGQTDVALGDSEYNRQELDDLGFTNTGVFPIAIDTARITGAPRRPALENTLQADGFLNFLFVGRIVPNKKIEDHIKLAEHYKRYVDESYRFVFVGKTDAAPRYFSTIQALMAEYRMPPGRFLFTSIHFFWDGEGCALRDYSDPTRTHPPTPDRSRKTAQIVPLIKNERVFLTNFLANDRVSDWRAIIEQQNRIWGIG